MLKRKIHNHLIEWKNRTDKKALIVTGARQVGKTTAIREFAKENYAHFVEVNFVKRPVAKQAFDGDLDSHTIFTNLSAMGFGPFFEGTTLVFFDEIQECPNARTAIKFLVEDGHYDIIESGSLLGINYKEVVSYPVGFEEEIRLFPLDFEEFLWAKGIAENVIDLLKQCYRRETPVPEFIHQQISKIYREYLVIGGMPEVVQKFIDSPDISNALRAQTSIITTYRHDISHYAQKSAVLVKRVFDAIPSQLGKQDKRFVLADIEKGASLRKYEDPTQWLIDAGLAYYSFKTKALELPFESTENRRLYKLYMVDTGLLCSLTIKEMQFEVLSGNIDINEGALTENFVASALAATGKSLHYYDKKSKQELDFIINERNSITIIEVKSGDNYKKHASLNAAIASFGNVVERAIVLCKGNVEKDAQVLYLPLYMAMFI
ncbi:MAG: AAA family ATPase [Bacteroidales bacterium]|nr:AAA family ATPase [Bacteroidales bacterium]